jgi:uncharacterized protein (DUF488 family)
MSRKKGQIRCASIGYQGRSLTGMCELLAENGITVVIDVRERAWSQRPDFRKGRLQAGLADFGIEYVHCREAGNPFRPKIGEPAPLERCEALYREHLNAHPEVLGTLEELMRREETALLCYEASRDSCHRGVLFESLAERWQFEILDL